MSGIVVFESGLEADFLRGNHIQLHFFRLLDGDVPLDIGIEFHFVLVGIEEDFRGLVGLARDRAAGEAAYGVGPHGVIRFGVGGGSTPLAQVLGEEISVVTPSDHRAVLAEPVAEVVGGGGDPLEVVRAVRVRDAEQDGVVRLRRRHGTGRAGTHPLVELLLREVQEFQDLVAGHGAHDAGVVVVDAFLHREVHHEGLLLEAFLLLGILLFLIVVDGDDVLGFLAGGHGHGRNGEHP